MPPEDIGPRDLKLLVDGIRYRKMQAQDLVALAICTLINKRAGFGMGRKSLREREMLGRGPADLHHFEGGSLDVRVAEIKESIKAREARILARYEANRKKKKAV